MTNEGSLPILFTDSENHAPKEISVNGKKIATLISLLESKNFVGSLTINMARGDIKLDVKQALRI